MNPGDWVVHSHFGLGHVIELLQTEDGHDAAKVHFLLMGEKLLALPYSRLRLATELEIASKYATPDYHHPYTQAECSLDQVEIAISSWAQTVGYLCKTSMPAMEDYRDDLADREEVDYYLAACHQAGIEIPVELAQRLAEADRQFVDATVETDRHAWGVEEDKTRFWYYYRWPLK